MKVTYSEVSTQRNEEYPLLQQITGLLEEALGPLTDSVSAEWDWKMGANGRPIYTLRLSDWAGSVSASFYPVELQPSHNLRIRVYQLLGELLSVRSHKQLAELANSGD